MRPITKVALITGLVLFVSTLHASPSEAQRRFHPRSRVFVGAYFGYPFYSPFYAPFYDPFWMGGYYPWGPYYWQGYPPAWGERERQERTVGVKTDITPKETQIYVDGYFSGTASDFDGLFKRLRVAPGQHEIVLYLKGYKTVRQTLDLKQGSDVRLREKMTPLAAGEANEAPPSPPPQAARAPEYPRGEAPPAEPTPNERPRRRVPPPPRVGAPAEARGFGALSIRVQPAGAEVLIDGDRWQGPEGVGPLVIQVSEGTHRIEVRKDGYVTFSTDVQVRQGETSPLNISLPEQR